MKSIIFLCILAMSFHGYAAIPATQIVQNQLDAPSISLESNKQHSKFFKRFLAKKIAKIFNTQPGNTGGKTFTLIGLGCLVALVVAYSLLPFAYFALVPLTVAGMLFSILGLVKAGKNGDKRIKRMAILGIIVNFLVLGGFLTVVFWPEK